MLQEEGKYVIPFSFFQSPEPATNITIVVNYLGLELADSSKCGPLVPYSMAKKHKASGVSRSAAFICLLLELDSCLFGITLHTASDMYGL